MKEIIQQGLDETLYYDKLDNGLETYFIVNEKVNNFYITLTVKYGSIDTEFKIDKEDITVPDGIAHFLEHVKFNEKDGTTAHDFYNSLGSSINAFTTYDCTSYEVMASNNFEINLTHLIEYVLTPVFTKELVEKEKGIICEEVKMGKNNPGHKMYYGTNKSLYINDKRRIYVTGDIDDVKSINVKDLNQVFDAFYHPANMFITITGNFNPFEANAIIKKVFSNMKDRKYLNPIRIQNDEPEKVNNDYKEIEANIEIPKVNICYKMSINHFKEYDDRILTTYLSIILNNNFGPTSDLKEELMEKELITGIYNSIESFNNIITFEISIETKYPDEVIPIIKNKMENLELNEEELKRRIKVNIAGLINSYDDIEYVNTEILEQVIKYGNVYDNYFGMINNLNIKDAKDILRKIITDNYCVVKLIPYKEKN